MKVQQNSSKYDSIEQLKKLFKHEYVINRISHPPTSDETECLLTVFGEEPVAISGFVKSPVMGKMKKEKY